RRQVGWRGFPPIGFGRHDDAVVDRRDAHAAVEQGGRNQTEDEGGKPRAPCGLAQNQAPQSASVWATVQGSTRPVRARTAPSASPASMPLTAGTFPPPLAGPVGPRERRFSARRAFETFGEGRVGASRSNQLMASRQPPNTIVLNRSPAGSRNARSSAAPR